MRYTSGQTQGFVALVAMLIFSTMLLLIVVSLSRYGIMARFALLDIERKAESEAVAQACLAVVRIMVLDDPLVVATHEIVPVDDRTCVIESIGAGPAGVRRTKVSAVVEGATTNYQADYYVTNGRIVRMIELTE